MEMSLKTYTLLIVLAAPMIYALWAIVGLFVYDNLSGLKSLFKTLFNNTRTKAAARKKASA